jgi:hypothetical protein
MKTQRFTFWVAMVAALAVAGLASANDRDFLREVAAAPNLIFILDTSSSMVASPEVTMTGDPAVPTAVEGALVTAAMVPGAGDDPYSRMGIAKKVLREFLDDVGEANVALAGYAQAQPSDGSNGVPQKHWVYEARAQDRFHMVEATYAYRMGYSENHAGIILDVPADILKYGMIGYKPYFNPATTPVTDRFGPLNAYDTGWVDYTYSDPGPPITVVNVSPPFDLMPMYFGNCFVDNMQTPLDDTDDVTLCDSNHVFPFYDSGVRDTSFPYQLIPESWYYGQLDPSDEDYPGCDPNDPIWDDGTGSPVAGACQNEWEETSGASLIQYRRRVRLEIPATYLGNPNHFFAVDSGGTPVGNTQVADGGAEDYDLDGFADPDYDEDETNDWMLYVHSVEERDQRSCVPAAALPTWTPTPTVTPTPTETFTPTPTPTPICRVTVDNMRVTGSGYAGAMGATIVNGHPSTAIITRIFSDWGANMRKWAYHDWMRICTDGAGTSYCGSTAEEIWDESTGSYSVVPYTGRYVRPVDLSGPPYVGQYAGTENIGAGVTTHWWAYLRDSAPYIIWDGYYQVCFDFTVVGGAPGGGDLSCPNVCAETYEGSLASPTPTPTITPTFTGTPWPTPTFTNTPIGGAPTATRTPTWSVGGPTNTPAPLSTSTPTPWPTSTPTLPPTPTRTQTPPPTATPVS